MRKIRERILNVVGHELLTPVTTVRGLAEANAKAGAAERERLAPLLQRNAQRLEGLVNDLLLASGVATVLPVGEPDRVLVADVVTAVWGSGETEFELVLDVPEDTAVRIQAGACQRVLDHVLRNARDYGRTPVTVTARHHDPDVEIVVDSPGKPLHPEEVRLATEPFYRGEHAVMSTAGLGLGLPVARALVEHAGGQLSVAVRPSGGLVTRIVLPADGPER